MEHPSLIISRTHLYKVISLHAVKNGAGWLPNWRVVKDGGNERVGRLLGASTTCSKLFGRGASEVAP